jgi:hypothetical protein
VGVSRSPSRSGSSPAHLSNVRTACSASSWLTPAAGAFRARVLAEDLRLIKKPPKCHTPENLQHAAVIILCCQDSELTRLHDRPACKCEEYRGLQHNGSINEFAVDSGRL